MNNLQVVLKDIYVSDKGNEKVDKSLRQVIYKQISGGTIIRNLKNSRSNVVSYFKNKRFVDEQGREYYIHYPPSFFADIESTYFHDSIVRRAVDSILSYIFLNGIGLVSSSSKYLAKTTDYFKSLFELTQDPFENLSYKVLTDLILYSNAFVHKIRGKDDSSVYINGKKVKEIIGIECISPFSLGIVTDGNGNVIKYIDITNKDTVYIPVEDIVHLKYYPNSKFLWSVPYMLPVLDDLVVLRRLEEDIYAYIFQHIVPLFHLKYNSEAASEDETRAQISEMELKIEEKLSTGALITTDRWSIEVPDKGASNLNDVYDYLEYFKQRVQMGLGLSALDFGETGTSNRATSQIVSKNIVRLAKTYSNFYTLYMNEFVMKEIITYLFGSKSKDVDVRIYIPEIDIEWKHMNENHGLVLYQNSAITLDEYRSNYLNLPTMSSDSLNRTYFYLFKLPTAIATSRDETVEGYLSTLNMPTNQYGTKESAGLKADEVSSLEDLIFMDSIKPNVKNYLNDIYVNKLSTLLHLFIDKEFVNFEHGIGAVYERMSEYMNSVVFSYAYKCIDKAIKDTFDMYGNNIEDVQKNDPYFIKIEDIMKYLRNNIFNDIQNSIFHAKQVMHDDKTYPTFVDKENRLKFNLEVFARTTMVRVYCAAKLLVLKRLGYEKCKIKFLLENTENESDNIDMEDKHFYLIPWKWHPNAVRDIVISDD